MNFQLAPIGHSFRGSMAYYLHDKRPDAGDPHPATAERVAWTETRNLATDGPHTATRMMIATAQSADELKAAAGIRATGRKATAGPVFAFSLQWRHDEVPGLDRAEMRSAADHALKVLGLGHLQAVMVAHDDRQHPHVHVIVNRVDPNTGRTEPIRKPAVLALDKWADRYERERGHIVSPNRAAKYDGIAQRLVQEFAGAAVPAAKQVAPAKPEIRAAAPDPSPVQILRALSEAQKARHKAEWPALSERNRAARATIHADYRARMAETVATHKDLNRPLWAAHFRREREQAQAFAAREKEVAGRIANALAIAKHQQASGQHPGRGLLSLTFANVLSSERRREVFTAQQDAARASVQRDLRHALNADMTALRQQRGQALDRQRGSFEKERLALIEGQTAERAKMREAWSQHYTRHGRDPQMPRESGADSQSQKGQWTRYRAGQPAPAPDTARPIAVPRSESRPVKNEFDKARTPTPEAPKPKVPSVNYHLSKPEPAPAPPGMQQPRHSPQPVPKVDKAAEWAKTPEGKRVTAPPAPPVRKEWKQATADTSAATKAPVKDWKQPSAAPSAPPPSPAKDWNKEAAKGIEIKPLPPRDPTRDRDR